MADEIDYAQHSETELVEMFGRLDPRSAPAQCARLGKFLTERGYVVLDGELGPGSALPSAAKMLALIGSSHPIEFAVDFGQGTGPFHLSEATRNELGLIGAGSLQVDGIWVSVTGERQKRQLLSPSQESYQLPCRRIRNAEARGRLVRFEYGADDLDEGAISLKLADEARAGQLLALLSKDKTPDAAPQIDANAQFTRRLIAQSPHTPVTVTFILINVLVFVATLFGGADWFKPAGAAFIAWGSNYGPYTRHGEWWRLVSSQFLHFGIVHLVSNMLALRLLGPTIERLYGSLSFMLIYLACGVAGGLTSIACHPSANSAGASGAIFGIFGALLAVQLSARSSIPRDILRPMQTWALLFFCWSVYAPLRVHGIDYAAHVGGLVAGLCLGLVGAHPVTGSPTLTRSDLRRLALLTFVAAILVGVGFLLTRLTGPA